MTTFKKLFYILNYDERNSAFFLLIMMIIMALLDMIGVASILPFMAVLSNPSVIETNIFLKKMFEFVSIFGVHNNEQFLFFLGLTVLFCLIFSLIFKAITTYFQIKFVQMREYSISKRLIEGYLHQPYRWFLHRHSSDLGKTILSEVQQVISLGLRPMMDLISKVLIALAIIILLFLNDIKLTLSLSFLLSGSYFIIFYFVRKNLIKIGNDRLENNELRFKHVNEAFSSIKEIKFKMLEQVFLNRYSIPSKNYAQNHATSSAISLLPRFVLEIIAFGGILVMILYLMKNEGNLNNSLPIISLYVFAGYRLMPALQIIYTSSTQLTFIKPSLDKLYKDINNLEYQNENYGLEAVNFDKQILLKNISFIYPKSSKNTLKNIDMKISSNSTIGIVGQTGSGKTTLIDIILGLLEATSGSLEVDGKIITKKNVKSWQSFIGYVPQDIYLSDDRIDANIAFGLDYKDINQAAVENACKIANIHEFIINELPEKYKTKVGERGVRLSGGQRQRIGIARALYKNPKLLVLDEATSALDKETERAVIDAVNNIKNKYYNYFNCS
jgi:ABC-type bacteriocin/lantibiotic exporter with double-glycine peptidase domain